MQPALLPGDRVLAWRWLRARPGHLVVVRDPEAPATYLIKRLVSITPKGELTVLGDNLNVSRDSRQFGPVPRRLLVGRVFYRYLPASRRVRL
jgi:nickel-type superoxide dismutase maturation protease